MKKLYTAATFMMFVLSASAQKEMFDVAAVQNVKAKGVFLILMRPRRVRPYFLQAFDKNSPLV